MLDYSTLQVGNEVAVARHATTRVNSEGIYTVIKANKMQVVIQRKHDGHERTFSVKRHCECNAANPSRSAFIEAVADKQARDNMYANAAKLRTAWEDVSEAAGSKNLAALQQAMAALQIVIDSGAAMC